MFAALLLTGCFADEPSKDHIRIMLESMLTRDVPLEIVKVEAKWVKTGEARLESKARISLRLKEDCYVPASLNDALAPLKLNSAETALLRQALDKVGAQAEPLRSSLLEQAPESLEAQQFIRLSEKAGTTLSAEVSLLARKGVEGWNLEVQNVSIPRTPNGRPRSAMLTGALIVGSSEARKLIQDTISAIRRYATLVDKTIADTARAQAETSAQKRATLLAAIKPGAIFMGTLESLHDKSLTETGIVIEEVQSGSGTIRGFMFAADPREKMPFTGVIRDDGIPVLLNISADRPMVAELDLRNGRLAGTFDNPYNSRQKATVSWAPVGKEALEAKITAVVATEKARKTEEERRKEEARSAAKRQAAERKAEEERQAEEARKAAERQAAEHKKRMNAYQTALAEAIAPGKAFQGLWTHQGQRAEVGLFIESVSANGLSCSGYLFDPFDRSMRKPFTATINRAFEAQDALIVTAYRGQGIATSSSLTEMQRNWLTTNQEYSIRFALKNNGWTGQTSARWSGDLTPVANFAELLAQDQAAEKAAEKARKAEEERQAAERKKQEDAYQAALAEAIAPGKAFQGLWTHQGQRAEVGLFIESVSANGLSCSGYLFDPFDRSMRKPFTATINRAFEAQDALIVTTAHGHGNVTSAKLTNMQRIWLAANQEYSISLALKKNGWTGQTSARWSGDLTPIANFAELLTQDQAAAQAAEKARKAEEERQAAERKKQEDAYQAALAEAIAPGKAFQGLWTFQAQRAEVGLFIENVSANGLSCTGYLFDPNDRSMRKPFTATINRAFEAQDALIVTAAHGQGNVTSANLTNMQRIWLAANQEYSISLALKNNGWTGQRNGTLDLAPVPNFAELLAQDQAAEKARKAEEERQAAERKKQMDAYQTALAKAVAPGMAFQGLWTQSDRRGEIGLAIESVSANGLSCTGYLFDPNDRFKRKPFTATIDRGHEAQDALNVTAARGQGVATSVNLTEMQRNWLGVDATYTIRLALQNGGWTGPTSGKAALNLTPVVNFAELLAQDQAAEEKRREALRAAMAPGSAWQGAFTCGSTSGEIGVYFESGNDRQVRGYLFDPAARHARKTFSGTASFDRDVERPLVLTTERNSGLKQQAAMLPVHQHWLREDITGTLQFAKVGDMLRGTTGNCSLELKPLADFAALLAQDAEAEKKRQEALRAAVAPGSAWLGAFTQGPSSGEIGVYFESGNDRQVRGYLFDPAARHMRKTFIGTLFYDRDAETFLTLETDRNSGQKQQSAIPPLHHWLREGNAITLHFAKVGGMLHGSAENRSLELKPLANFAALLAQDAKAEKKRQEAVQAAIAPGASYLGIWQTAQHVGEVGMRILTRGSSGVVFTAELFGPEEPNVVWPYNGSIRNEEGETLFTLIPAAQQQVEGKSSQQPASTQSMLNNHRKVASTVRLTLAAEGLSGTLADNITIAFKTIGAPASAMATPTAKAAPVAYPPLAADGKPRAAVHLVHLENDTVELALQVLAPGKTLETIRIDNLGGAPSLWRSDGKDGGAPLSVSRDGNSLGSGAEAMNLALGDAEALLSLSLKDNGAFAGKATDFRVTLFFNGGERAMCMLKAQ